MRKMISLLAICLIVACHRPKKPEQSQSSVITDTAKQELVNQKAEVETPPTSIEEIKAIYAETVGKLNRSNLDSLTLNYDCRKEKSGKIIYYRDKGKIVLIKHVYAEYDHHEAVDQYFVQANTLYFTYFKRLNWSFDGSTSIEGATKDNITESRSYLLGGQLVSCLEKKYTIYSASLDKVLPQSIPNRSIKCSDDNKMMTTFSKLIKYQNHANGDCFE